MGVKKEIERLMELIPLDKFLCEHFVRETYYKDSFIAIRFDNDNDYPMETELTTCGPVKRLKMTELEVKLFHVLMARLKVLAPMRGVEMTEGQMHQLAVDLAITTAKVLVTEKSMEYKGKK